MAEKEAATEAASEAAPPKKGGKKKLIIIAAAAVVLLGGGGAAAYVLLGKKGAHSEAAKSDVRKMPVFVDLDTFTVNLKDNDGERFLQAKLVAEVKDPAGGEMVKTLMPAVRNEILLLLGSKDVSQISNREGKEALAKEIVAAANKPLRGTPQAGTVESVNFTHLIIQ
jgi:flagellar protein FliL